MQLQDYPVGWVCALPIETIAARGMLDEHHPPLPQALNDHNSYILGRVGAHNVVIASLPAGVAGSASTAIVAKEMCSTFQSIRFALLVGIGGGAPSSEHDIRLGDVVVGMHTRQGGGVVQYDVGKSIYDNRVVRTGSLKKPLDILLMAVAKLKARHLMEEPALSKYFSEMLIKNPILQSIFTNPGPGHDQLFEAGYQHQGNNPTCLHCDISRLQNRPARHLDEPVIHYGPIASGNQVMKDGMTRDRLRGELGVLCFEMEAAGLMENFPCLVIRGICDYADSHKNSNWQSYAAATAAAYAKELLCVIPERQVLSTRMAVLTNTIYGKSSFYVSSIS